VHEKLVKQLQKTGVLPDEPALRPLLALVDEAYCQADADRAVVERSRDRTLRELLDRNEQLQRYRVLFDESPLAVLVFDAVTLRIVECNLGALALYGYAREELTALRISDLKVESADPELRAAGAASRVWRGTKTHRKKDGTPIDLAITSHPVLLDGRPAILAMCADVTDTRRLEEQLRQSQKMEAVGRLAGGIAHDFNNILAVILSETHLVGSALEPEHPMQAEVREIEIAARRAAALTRQLLTFSRQQPREPKLLGLGAVVSDLSRMLTRVIGEDVHLSARHGAHVGWIEADAGQIEQVLMNLVVNARDAMPTGGRVTIETANVELDPRRAAEVGVSPGKYVMLSVGDTGGGIDAATRVRIFEPFFTTKKVGKGTGLGLAMVFGIVNQAGGGIAVESELGRGTTFKLYFPYAAAPVRTISAVRRRVNTERQLGTILLVEDDAQVRAAVSKLLTTDGYTVVEVQTPRMALDVLAEHGRAVDLVLTDVVMPGMDGKSMVERMRADQPDVKVLFMSGHPDHPAVVAPLGPHEHFIQKPFTASEIGLAVRGAIRSSA
jgi:PAS domain S-box-containing protein